MPLRRFLPALLLAAAPMLAAGPPEKQPPLLPYPKTVLDPVTRPLVDGNTRFALDLYKQLRAAEGNLFISPLSISSALTLTTAGAAGKTHEQMVRTLHSPRDGAFEMLASLDQDLSSRAGKGIRLTSLGRVWVNEGMDIKPAFRDALAAAGAAVEAADFVRKPEVGRLMVNKWAKDNTGGQITDLLPGGSVTPLTRVVLASAVHFKGDWASKFDAAKTAPGTFATPTGRVTVPMMSQYKPFVLAETKNGAVIELPYAGDQFAMVLAVPTGKKKLRDVEQDLIDGLLTAALAKGVREKVEVTLPRFKMATSLQLSATLRAMGMDDAFGPTADFSGIDGSKDLYLSGVFHKAALEVSEEGTEASAATGVVISARSGRSMFHADQPFVFLIRDRKTGTILFMGRVVDPTK